MKLPHMAFAGKKGHFGGSAIPLCRPIWLLEYVSFIITFMEGLQ